MNLTCVWCSREGKYGDLREKEISEGPPTHGICARHEAQLLPALQSLSFPEIELLVVVHQHDHQLFDYLERRFADVRGVKVILERRKGDRRHEATVTMGERRQSHRRVRQGQVSSLGYRLVRFRRR